jgi:hypothetical protein
VSELLSGSEAGEPAGVRTMAAAASRLPTVEVAREGEQTMALVDSVADWAQVALNAGALLAGGVVWKMYFENLKATIGTKDAEVSLANKQADYWREKAEELEKRSPEVVERVLAERISIREQEIERLSSDQEHGTQELGRVKEEVRVLNRTLEQTKGFLAVLEMEGPDPDHPDYDEYMEYLKEREDRVVEVEVKYLGVARVDSGQLMITDPCYILEQWLDEPFDRVNRPEEFHYSYDGACQATLSKDGFGQLVFGNGHAGAGVVFQSGWGDGYYGVYGEKHDGRIVRVYVNCGADPIPLSQGAPDVSGPPD